MAMWKHVMVYHINGNPHDRRLYQIGLTCKGRWDVRRVREDDHGYYVVLGGVRWYLDDPDTAWIPVVNER